ncbi:hypothetical protein BC629DRAFT_1168052 [Irpex lacteus]|nr:hypothetical protein BC629DRAFT_1168052 [Irpex lacteus]
MPLQRPSMSSTPAVPHSASAATTTNVTPPLSPATTTPSSSEQSLLSSSSSDSSDLSTAFQNLRIEDHASAKQRKDQILSGQEQTYEGQLRETDDSMFEMLTRESPRSTPCVRDTAVEGGHRGRRRGRGIIRPREYRDSRCRGYVPPTTSKRCRKAGGSVLAGGRFLAPDLRLSPRALQGSKPHMRPHPSDRWPAPSLSLLLSTLIFCPSYRYAPAADSPCSPTLAFVFHRPHTPLADV